MLKNFTKRILSRRKSFWLLLFFVLLTFLLRLPTLFRSFDLAYESQLAYFGREAFVGNGFYGSPWSMKGPGETFVYGLAYLVFGHSSWAFGVRIITTILAGLAAFTIYLIGKKLYMPLVGLFTAVFFALFFSRGANFAGTLSYAEMLMPFFTVLGVFFFLKAQEDGDQKSIFLAGLSFGFSLFFKQSALYDFLPFFIYGFVKNYLSSKKIIFAVKKNFLFGLGFLLPLGVFVLYIALIGRFSRLWDWMIVKPSLYAKLREKDVFGYLKNIFRTTYSVWIMAYVSILMTVINKEKKKFVFILWFFFTFLTFITSGKMWNYYFIQPFLPACFLAGGLIAAVSSLKKKKYSQIIILISFVFLLINNFKFYWESYRPFWQMLKGKQGFENYVVSLSEKASWLDLHQATNYLNQRLKKQDKLFALESNTSMYVMTDRSTVYDDYIFDQQFFENKAIGFAFNHNFQKVEKNRRDLVNKLVENPPDYFAFVLNSNDDALQKLVSFPWIFAFVFKNYRYLDNFGNVWIYQKGEEIIIPKELSLEPNFAKWYLITIEKN